MISTALLLVGRLVPSQSFKSAPLDKQRRTNGSGDRVIPHVQVNGTKLFMVFSVTNCQGRVTQIRGPSIASSPLLTGAEALSQSGEITRDPDRAGAGTPVFRLLLPCSVHQIGLNPASSLGNCHFGEELGRKAVCKALP